MAVRKISEFKEVLSLKDNDRILLERNGEPKFIKASNLLSYFNIEAPTFEGVINISGDHMLNPGGDNILAYDKCEGIYNWISNRDFENITITYKGNIYKYTTKAAGEYLGLFISEFSEEGYIQIYGQTANASTFDFTLMIMSDNVTSDSFPEEVKEKDNVVLYCGDLFGITNTDLPVSFEVENNKVINAPTFNIIDNKVDITFDKNSVAAWANMPNEHWTDKNEKNGYLKVNVPGLYDWINYNSYGDLNRLKLIVDNETYNFCNNNLIDNNAAFSLYPQETQNNSLMMICQDPINYPDKYIIYSMIPSTDITDNMIGVIHKDDFLIMLNENSTTWNLSNLPINVSFKRITGNENPTENSITDNEVNLTFTSDNIKTIESAQIALLHLDGISDWLNRKRLSQATISLEGYDCTYKNVPEGTSFPYEGFQYGPYDSDPALTMIMACTIGVARAFLLFANQDTSDASPSVEISKDDILLDLSNLFSQDFNIDDLPLHIKIFCDSDINTEDDYIEDNEINLNFKSEDIKNTESDGITIYYCLKNLPGITDWIGNKAPSDISLYINDAKYEFTAPDSIDINGYFAEDIINKKDWFMISTEKIFSEKTKTYSVFASDYINGYPGREDGSVEETPASIYGIPYKIQMIIFEESSTALDPVATTKDDIFIFVDYPYTSLMPKDFPLNIRFEFNDDTIVDSNKIDATFYEKDITNAGDLNFAIKNISGCLDWFNNKNLNYVKAKINGVIYQHISQSANSEIRPNTKRYWSTSNWDDGLQMTFSNTSSDKPLLIMQIPNKDIESEGVSFKKDDFIVALGGLSYFTTADLPINVEFIYEEPSLPAVDSIEEREVNIGFRDLTTTVGDAIAVSYKNVAGISDWFQSKSLSDIVISVNGIECSYSNDSKIFDYAGDLSVKTFVTIYISPIKEDSTMQAIAMYIVTQDGDSSEPLDVKDNVIIQTMYSTDNSNSIENTQDVLPINIKLIYMGE